MAEETAVQRNLAKMGEVVGGILQNRFYQKQAEDFLQNEFQQFQNSTAEFHNKLPTIEDGDQLAQEFVQWKNNTLMPFITNATAKYARNDRIMNVVKQVHEANQEGLSEYMQVEQAGRERALQTPVGEEREMRAKERQAKLAGVEAETEANRATAAYRRAQAGKTAREGELDPLQRNVIPPNMLQTIDLGSARRLVNDPRFPDWKQGVDRQADQAAVSRIISENMGREKEDGTRWGQDRDADIQDAERMWAGSAVRKKTLEAARLQAAGYTLDRAQGYYDDVAEFLAGGGSPLLPEEKVPPLRAGAKQSAAVGRIFASDSETMRAQGWNFDTVDTFVKKTLPRIQDYRELGPHVSSILEQSVIRDADGTAIAPQLGGRQIKTYNELLNVLRASWNIRVRDTLFQENATALKAGSEKMGNEIIRRFAPVIATRLGIEVPKRVRTELERAGEPGIVKLLRAGRTAAETIGGRLLREFGEEEL